MMSRQVSCAHHKAGCTLNKHLVERCTSHGQNALYPYSTCIRSLLEITAHRLFLLHPLLVALGIPEAVMRDQLASTRKFEPHWCVERLLDASDTHVSISEAVSSLTTNHLFRTYVPHQDTDVDRLVDKDYGSLLGPPEFSRRACSCASTLPLQWAAEFAMAYDSLAAFLLSHKCANSECVGCVALTLAVLDREKMIAAQKELVLTHDHKFPLLRWIVHLPKFMSVICYPEVLIASGYDLTPFFHPSTWHRLDRMFPSRMGALMGVDEERIGAVRLLARMLGLVDMKTLVRLLANAREQHTLESVPLTFLFDACRSLHCGPLLLPVVCSFVDACTREDLVAWWYHSKDSFSRSAIATCLFDNAHSAVTNAPGRDFLVSAIVPMLCGKLGPDDLLSTTYRLSSYFADVCARGRYDVVVEMYEYVKDEMANAGMSIAVPHRKCEMYTPYKDYLLAAVRHNTPDVCAFLFVAARTENAEMAVLMRPRWAAAAADRGIRRIMEIFEPHQMVKGAM